MQATSEFLNRPIRSELDALRDRIKSMPSQDLEDHMFEMRRERDQLHDEQLFLEYGAGRLSEDQIRHMEDLRIGCRRLTMLIEVAEAEAAKRVTASCKPLADALVAAE